jgi:H+-transporting ATPase
MAAQSHHVSTNPPSGSSESEPEKSPEKAHPSDDEEEDMDTLIEELESEDDHTADEDDVADEISGARPVPEELLQTDTRLGLTDSEVLVRRRKYGLNQMKEEKENLILKFFSYFVGPIQFVMEVSPDGGKRRANKKIQRLGQHRRCG